MQSTSAHTSSKPVTPLRVASWNVAKLGINPQDTARYAQIAAEIIDHLHAPHILAVQELTDDSGAANDGVTSATANAQRLIEALRTYGGMEYCYCDCAPENNKDGGEKGANIRNGFFYRPDRVALVTPQVSPKVLTGQAASIAADPEAMHLVNANPARIYPHTQEFEGARKPLIAHFRDRLPLADGMQDEYLITNIHLSANVKAFAGSPADEAQVGKLRRNQTKQVAQFLNQIGETLHAKQTKHMPHMMVVGDFNEHRAPSQGEAIATDEETPLSLLEKTGLWLASDWLPDDSYSSRSRDGTKSTIDHLLVSRSLRTRLAGIEQPRMTEQSHRSSDHNPIMVSISPTRLQQTEWIFSLGARGMATKR